MATKSPPESTPEKGQDPSAEIVRAGLIIIGDEILSGRTQDKNINFIATRLEEHGIQLAQIRIISDNEHDIIDAVNAFRGRYRYVFTTGGIGPTHDDITATSIAKAFGRVMERNTDALKRLRVYYKTEDFNDARQRMADMPRDVHLIDNPVTAAPGFIIENVYVMAGVPNIMQAMFDGIVGNLKGGKPMKSRTIQTELREGQIANTMAKIQGKNPKVIIGSYPFFNGDGTLGVSIVLRSIDEFALQKATQEIRAMIDDISAHSTSKAL